jgi:hypothetical protein
MFKTIHYSSDSYEKVKFLRECHSNGIHPQRPAFCQGNGPATGHDQYESICAGGSKCW